MFDYVSSDARQKKNSTNHKKQNIFICLVCMRVCEVRKRLDVRLGVSEASSNVSDTDSAVYFWNASSFSVAHPRYFPWGKGKGKEKKVRNEKKWLRGLNG
jgi:hypothetical protein